MKALKLKIAGGTAALAAVIGGGAAKLDAALKQALENRVDAAVKAGTLTAAQGAELKQRIEAGEMPLIGIGPGRGLHHGHHGFVDFAAAAKYLGVTEAKLRASLEAGDTLAEIAKANGKTAAGGSEGRNPQEGRGRPPHVGATGVDSRRPRVAHRRRRQRRVRVRLPRRARRSASRRRRPRRLTLAPPPHPRPGRPPRGRGNAGFLAIS